MDQRRWLLFLLFTTILYVVFYLLFLVPYQKKLETHRKAHPELLRRTDRATTETLTATTGTVTSVRPGIELTSATARTGQRPTTATVELQATEIVIRTRLYRVILTSRGGRPTSWQYFDRIPGKPEPEVVEMIPRRPDSPERELPLEIVFKESNRAEYYEFNTGVYQYQVVALDGDSTQVIFTSPEIEHLQMVKTYQFRSDSHLTHLSVVFRNLGDKAPCRVDDDDRGLGIAWGPGVGEYGPDAPRNLSYFVYTIYGTPQGVLYAAPTKPAADERSQRAEEYRREVAWAGVTDKFFMAVVIPDGFKPTAVQHLVRPKNVYSKEESSRRGAFRSPPFTVVLYNDKFTVEPQHEVALDYNVFVGPKRRSLLGEIGEQTGHDFHKILFYSSYRWMRALKLGLMYSLNFLYLKTHNYGVAIIILTVLIRLLLHPLAQKQVKLQAKTAAELQKIKPLLDEINRKYKDDFAKRSQEMQRLYKEHGVNPFSSLRGCLPMALQLPVFFALWSLFSESIDLRGASFLWIADLSNPDNLMDLTRYGVDFQIPLFGVRISAINLLPILMGISQYFMSKMMPTPTQDATQKQMMLIFTILFPVMLYNFPSGLFIYWLINNIWQTTHQMIISRGTAKPPAGGAAGAKA